MTTGEYLVAHSTLPSGTALAHLLALRIGSGPGETIFASSLAVYSEEYRFTVESKPKRDIPWEDKPSIEVSEREKNAFSLLRQNTVFCFSAPDEQFITSRRENNLVVQRRAAPLELVRIRNK